MLCTHAFNRIYQHGQEANLALTVCRSLTVRLVNNYDVSSSGCDGAGGPGDFKLVADIELHGCLREIEYGGGSPGLNPKDLCYDCSGVGLGDNRADECGQCDDDMLNDCQQDCAGVWGGPHTEDECGVCDRHNTFSDSWNALCEDCDLVPYGPKLADHCGGCDTNTSNDCVTDCAGTWGGSLTVDSCDVCGGDGTACLYDTVQLKALYSFEGVAAEDQIYDSLRSYYTNYYDPRNRQPRADVGIALDYLQVVPLGMPSLPAPLHAQTSPRGLIRAALIAVSVATQTWTGRIVFPFIPTAAV